MNQLASFLNQLIQSVTVSAVVLSIAFVVFALMERMFSLSTSKKSRRSTFLDVRYALLSMLYPPFISFIISAVIGLLAIKLTAPPPAPEAAFSAESLLSFAGQLLALLFLRDFIIYLRHRIFHTRPIWAFHSIHHSSEEVDWLSAVRFHPVESMIEASGEVLIFLGFVLWGFSPTVLSVGSFVIGFYNFFIHSNLRWTFGPLRYVLVSPVLHRWHHSDSPKAQDKNFAAMFSCIDLVLGTFYMPKDSMPLTTGLSKQERTVHPRTFRGQLLYPFRKR